MVKGKSKVENKNAIGYLNKTQEVLYQKEFKRANNVYDQLSHKNNRS
ncbi:YfhE family protein [Virgibacillus sp. DJP39]